jgi:hypothetical protein
MLAHGEQGSRNLEAILLGEPSRFGLPLLPAEIGRLQGFTVRRSLLGMASRPRDATEWPVLLKSGPGGGWGKWRRSDSYSNVK